MPDLTRVRDRVWSLFLSPSPPQRTIFAAAVMEGRAQGPRTVFSAFNPAHVARALAITAEFMRVANEQAAEEALDAVLDAYEARRGVENPDLLDYALTVFITHHPRGAALTHAIPPITLRNPELVAPSRTVRRDGRTPGGAALARAMGLATAPVAFRDPTPFAGGAVPSDALEWYREDPFANEHHSHWHVVYPTRGVPNSANPSQTVFKDRQGEIFFYMHQQMLARYDAERLALGLPRVAPLSDYRARVAVGYNPGDILGNQGFGVRAPDLAMVDIPGDATSPPYTVTEHETARDNVSAAIGERAYTAVQPPIAMTDVSLLGGTVEANGAGIGSVAGGRAQDHYGNLHNLGHGLLAQASSSGSGVMATTATAIRDPVFYEWHKHIDDFYAEWQGGGVLNTFDDRPPVLVRKGFDPVRRAATSPDLMFVFEDQLPSDVLGNLDGWAQETFGDEHWDRDFTGLAPTTDTLETAMLRRQMTLADRITSVPVDHLTHRPFIYVFRVENRGQLPSSLTVRVFIAPIADTPGEGPDDRRAWIEMDKFVLRLAAGEKKVAVRRGAQSSVVRKPADMTPPLLKEVGVIFDPGQLAAMAAAGLSPAIVARLEPLTSRELGLTFLSGVLSEAEWNETVPFLQRFASILPAEQPRRPSQDDTPDETEQQEALNYCTCGWPYNLLLPRGTPQGMRFRLAVVCSDWQIDQVGGDESCGSLSFCGARDRYPDRRPMGYPFNARFADGVTDIIMANASMAFRDFTIRRAADATAND